MARRITRGRLTAFDLMPSEAADIIAWAAGELAARERTQTDIHAEFITRCEALMAEHRGELEFAIPAFSSFNRYSIRQAQMSRRLDETNRIVAVLSSTFDAKKADDLTVMTAETIKALVFQMLGDAADGMDPKDAMLLASAFKQATQAQSISSDRRQKLQKEFDARVVATIDNVARAKGLTAETAEAIKAQILGVTA